MANHPDDKKVVIPTADGIANAAKAASKKGPPPVHLWNPPHCGHIDMRIARDGTWFYMGTPIGRAALVKLFSTILRRDGDDYVLVTPVEKVGITADGRGLVAKPNGYLAVELFKVFGFIHIQRRGACGCGVECEW